MIELFMQKKFLANDRIWENSQQCALETPQKSCYTLIVRRVTLIFHKLSPDSTTLSKPFN